MSRNLLFLLTLVWLPTALCMGQRKLSISATVTPTLSHTNYIHRYYYPNSDGQIVEPVYVNGIRWATGYSAGVSVLYEYVPGWSVSSGIMFQQLTTRQARPTTAGDGTTSIHNRAIRVPLLLNYASSTKPLSPYFSFGLLTDVPLPSRVVVNRTGQSTQYLKLETSTRPILHLLLGVGGQYQINKRYTVMAQPIWTYKFGQLGGASAYNSSFEVSLLTQLAYTF
ncbi:porin family protein [Spirosoma fluviale]|uniref:Outer membrane protein beta-barrel domain-containing protein n=1 Tax=Spirosoma fluviale TaxID=1597977 RepID=A0A286FAU2_9BACT|nr:outer membrane beta-barrel protein [Spirosoma fluviale]SOD80357.1 Outer membrane protein beta-barrel domain-containing protein [Spirosoma fluviale]